MQGFVPIMQMGRPRPSKGRNLVLLLACIGQVVEDPVEGIQHLVSTEEEADLQISGPHYDL